MRKKKGGARLRRSHEAASLAIAERREKKKVVLFNLPNLAKPMGNASSLLERAGERGTN